MTATVLSELVLPNISGLPADAAVNTAVLTAVDLATAVTGSQGFWSDFMNTQGVGGFKVASFISQTISRVTGATVKTFDISAALAGGPHGSPVDVFSFNLDAPTSAVDIPSEVAVCVSFHADLTGQVEEGAVDNAIPTPAQAVRFGAPAVHSGRDRPRARRRGRFYIGPLSFGAVQTSGGAQCLVQPNLITALKDAASRKIAANTYDWVVWSRRDAATHVITGGYIDNEFDTVRRRRIKTTTRTGFS